MTTLDVVVLSLIDWAKKAWISTSIERGQSVFSRCPNTGEIGCMRESIG